MNRRHCSPWTTSLLILALFTIPSCATLSGKPQATSIGPYSQFNGRLIVIEPSRRWQVLLKWQAESQEQGWLRLTHAATGKVVEFQWLFEQMHIRDNSHPEWQPIGRQKLAEQGIVIPPQQLASILLGAMPAHFKRKNGNIWESRKGGNLIRLQWQAEQQKLSMTDMAHGRTATLIIQP